MWPCFSKERWRGPWGSAATGAIVRTVPAAVHDQMSSPPDAVRNVIVGTSEWPLHGIDTPWEQERRCPEHESKCTQLRICGETMALARLTR